MARTAIPVLHTSRYQVASVSSLTVVSGNTVDGMSMVNDGATVIVLRNRAGTPESIALTVVETVDFAPAGPVVIPVASSVYLGQIGPFPVELYGSVLEFAVSDSAIDFVGFSLL